MIDTEVQRLRRLRDTALKARALATVMDPYAARGNTVYSRSAVGCWRIARVITGRLRAHPYLRYQRGPSGMRAVGDRVSTALLGGIARYRGQSLQTYCAALQRVARELDDARALTWSTDLSDALGRAQTQIRGLIRELEAGTRKRVGSRIVTTPGAEMRSAAVRDDAVWPYLAF